MGITRSRLTLPACMLAAVAALSVPPAHAGPPPHKIPASFGLPTAPRVPPASRLSIRGKAAYFILEPGWTLTFEGRANGVAIRVVTTVTGETKIADSVETRVVEERETTGAELTEVSRNYFVIDTLTGTAYCFGEDVDQYKDGKVSGHDGSWLAGEGEASPGVAMPGAPRVGDHFYMEWAPRRAMDAAEVVSVSEVVKTPAGSFRNCVKTRETTPLEPGMVETKLYAKGVGLVVDGSLKLVKIERKAS